MRKASASRKNWERSGKDARLLEWRTCDNDAEWQNAQQEPPAISAPQPVAAPRLPRVVRHWRIAAALLTILAMIGGWMWSTAERGIAQIEAEIGDKVELDLGKAATEDDGLRSANDPEIHQLSISAQDDGLRPAGEQGHPLTSTVKLLDFPGDTAIVQLVTQPGADQPALRQTRFYRQLADGWQRIKPDAELWRAPRILESSHFIFHFRQNDAQVVNLVAPQLDDMYNELQRNFGLTSDAGKMDIEVSVEQATAVLFVIHSTYDPLVVPSPIQVSVDQVTAALFPRSSYAPLVVPSPAVYLAPVELSDDAILAQSIALPLIDYMGKRAIEEHAIPTRWLPLLRGLRLWQLWHLDLPLAQWQQELVKWLYVDAPKALAQHQPMLPARYQEICAMHLLWTPSPELVGIPLTCSAWGNSAWSPDRWMTYVPRSHLAQLSVPRAKWENEYDTEANNPYHASEAIVLANLIDYALAVYGDEKLPLLVDGLAHYDSWETLVPAIFGVTAADFEAGWRSDLAQQYGVSLSD